MKSLFNSVSMLIVIAVLAIIVILFLGWSRVPDMLANSLSKKMKVSVEIDDIDLSYNSIELEKIEIGNPPHSILPKAFSAEVIDIFAPIKNYFDQDIAIDMIKVDDIYVGLELEASGNNSGNWTIIMNNSRASSPPSKERRTVLIKKLILSNISIDLVYRNERRIQKLPPIDVLEFTNVSTRGGSPLELISVSILRLLVNSVLDQANLGAGEGSVAIREIAGVY